MQGEPWHLCSRLGRRPLLWWLGLLCSSLHPPSPPFSSSSLAYRVVGEATSGGRADGEELGHWGGVLYPELIHGMRRTVGKGREGMCKDDMASRLGFWERRVIAWALVLPIRVASSQKGPWWCQGVGLCQ
jgi:hypothetical protein